MVHMAKRFRSLPFRALYAISFISFLFMALVPSVALGLPLVAITRPTQGAVVSGVILIDVAFRSDSNRPITRLEIYIDDSLAREVDLPSPLLEGRQSFNWDFSYLSNSVHKISARAVDSSGSANTASINVNVQNAATTGPDRIPPVVRIYYPAQGAKVRGMVEIKAEATDNVGVELVYFYIDGRLHKMIMKAPPYVDQWDTTREADGTHVLEAVAVDAAENEARSAQVTVIVENHNLTAMAPAGTAGATPSPLPSVPSVAAAPAPQPAAAAPSVSIPPVTDTLPVAPGAPSVASAPSWQPTPTPHGATTPTVPLPQAGGPWVPQIQGTPAPLPAPGQPQVAAPSAARSGPASLAPATVAPEAPKVSSVTPRALPLGPVPQAPLVTELPTGPSVPLNYNAGRIAEPGTLSAPVGPAAAPQANLTRPQTLALAAPQAAASERLAPKTMAPSLQPLVTATPPTTVAPAAAPSAPAGPTQTAVKAPATSTPPSLQVSTGPRVSTSGLAPLTATSPQLTAASKPAASPSKSSAPGSYAPTLVAANTPRGATPATGATSQPVSRTGQPGLTPLRPVSSPETVIRQQVTPSGPAVATALSPVDLSPIMAVAPTPKAAPTGVEALKTTTPAQVPTATTPTPTAKPVASQPGLAAAPSQPSPPERVALMSRPPLSPATLTEAIFAEYRGTPIPAERMLARLPDNTARPLPADGRITTPAAPVIAAVPVAVAKVRDIRIVFDGEVLSLRATPETRQGVSLAPLREIFEQADGVLYWFPVEKQVQAVNKTTDVKLRIGDRKVTVNGQTQTLEVAPYIKQGRTMVPLQFIADILDVSINFDNRTGQILISSNQF
jgi:hypothetical protein